MGVWSHWTPQVTFASACVAGRPELRPLLSPHTTTHQLKLLEEQWGVWAEHSCEGGRGETKETTTTSEDPVARENVGTI